MAKPLRSNDSLLDIDFRLLLVVLCILIFFVGESQAETLFDGNNCTDCHNESPTSGYPKINVSAMNATSAYHNNLNNRTGDPGPNYPANWNNRRCWACHTNGSGPDLSDPLEGHMDFWDDAAYARIYDPWNCTDCHTNSTGGYNSSSGLSNYSAPRVDKHLNSSGLVNFNVNFQINTSVNCTYCHSKSVINANDTVVGENNSAISNVSHYGTNASLVPGGFNTSNCTTCHFNVSVALEWGLQSTVYVNYTIRHGADISSPVYCAKCHNNSAGFTFHSSVNFKRLDVHLRYDWENDGFNDTDSSLEPAWNFESCVACHESVAPVEGGPVRTCEDCHLNTSIGPFTFKELTNDNFTLRSDWNDSGFPYVYEHVNNSANFTNGSGQRVVVSGVEVKTGNISKLLASSNAVTKSTCLAWDNSTGNGSCHGLSYHNRSGVVFFAHSEELDKSIVGTTAYDPYLLQQPVDLMPDTTNCTYCHLGNATVREKWGNAANITNSATRNHTETTLAECYTCHVSTGAAPFNFHDRTLMIGGTCRTCHFSYDLLSGNNAASDFVNETNFNQSVHWNQSAIDCADCHTNTSTSTANHTGSNYLPPDSGLKWCECCHAVVPVNGTQVPIISTGMGKRHNLTYKPQDLQYYQNGALVNFRQITNCTFCHDSTLYTNAVANFNRTSGKDCRYCHPFSDLSPGGD